MSTSQHSAAVRRAVRTGDELGRMFARMGTADHPRGVVLSAYRNARRAVQGNAGRFGAVSEVMAGLAFTVNQAMGELIHEANQMGTEQAEASLAVYSIPAAPIYPAAVTSQAAAAVTASLAAQAASVQAAALGRDAESVIMGDAQRAGLLSPAPLLREGARQLASVANAAFGLAIEESLQRAGDKSGYRRQAIAAVDERTTDCCLRVHGQVVGLRQPFHLTGTPRYADYLMDPGFHWWCRSSVALVLALDAEDELTGQMRSAAGAELEARARTGERVEIHPAHARSGRT